MNRQTRLHSSIIGIIILILLFTVSLNTDDSEAVIKTQYEPDQYTSDDLQIIDTKTGDLLHIGMTKQEITELYGKEDKIQFNLYQYEGLRIAYRDDVVVQFFLSINDNQSNRFQTYREIGLGDSLEQLLANYGEKHANLSDSYGATRITYIVKKNGNELETVDFNDPALKTGDKKSLYFIDFACDDEITVINMGDLESIQNMQ
ncbi:hypothetical protein M3650_27010 [Paenibacillus sp. MER TA 81-3]|uniref:hypothetical protein n=1 Tax=Paenibacillus sp. MER TA 81-3 TaxID=2939573 RepID=UPI00203B42B3|nr:hypothetical protein [Paenibacillus sp. MER TA 81-3]MCM3342171.1 hypothetical protein [Paenibacillus sp. MER TA 81-3]